MTKSVTEKKKRDFWVFGILGSVVLLIAVIFSIFWLTQKLLKNFAETLPDQTVHQSELLDGYIVRIADSIVEISGTSPENSATQIKDAVVELNKIKVEFSNAFNTSLDLDSWIITRNAFYAKLSAEVDIAVQAFAQTGELPQS